METSYSDIGGTGTDLRGVFLFPALQLAVTLLIIAGQEAI